MKKNFSIWILASITTIAAAQPGPGDVFREFIFQPSYDKVISNSSAAFSELDPDSKQRFNTSRFTSRMRIADVRTLEVDLNNAIRAEMSVEYWGGHIGTSEQKFKVNGHDWIYIPQPVNTPGNPECFHRTLLGNSSVPIPLEYLRNGHNEFQFTAGPQICYSFDFGFYWIYAFIVRVYYGDNVGHPDGKVIMPGHADTIGDFPEMEVVVKDAPAQIASVDFIGYYDDYDWEGNGVYRQWHYQTNYGRMRHHVGSQNRVPYRVIWSNEWVPEQSEPMRFMAKITDVNGVSSMTAAVENVKLVREERSVRMYKSDKIPEKFSVRIGRKASCRITVPDDPSMATRARLLLSTWSGKTNDGSLHAIYLNGNLISDNFGRFHDYSFDYLHVPVQFIQKGHNEIMIHSEFQHHMLEVNWPGPVLILEYPKKI